MACFGFKRLDITVETMASHIVFLTSVPWFIRDRDRFGLRELVDEGFSIDVWVLGPLLFPRLSESVLRSTREPPIPARWFGSYTEVKAALAELCPDKVFVMAYVELCVASLPLFRLLSTLKIRYGISRANSLPAPAPIHQGSKQKSLALAFRRLIGELSVQRVMDAAVRHILPRSVIGVSSPSIIVVGGSRSIPPSSSRAGLLPLLYAHQLDYDKYLSLRSGEGASVAAQEFREVAVFIDHNPVSDSDYDIYGCQPPCTEDRYYPALCAFFAEIERKLGLEVVIAAHPKTSRDERAAVLFEGRRVFHGKTDRLISGCSLVINHYSTAVNFAVLFRKPLVFLTSDQLDNGYMEGRMTLAMAECFGKIPINIDGNIAVDWNRELEVDEKRYEAYQEAYIKTKNSPQCFSWSILGAYLKSLDAKSVDAALVI